MGPGSVNLGVVPQRAKATSEVALEDLLEKGYQLSYFIIRDRSAAILALTSALEKLRIQHGLERRRFSRREKHPEQSIRRIARNNLDTLQWLIMLAAEPIERDQERQRTVTPSDLALRYVKFLIRITVAMSSFHVAVGLNRLLYNYSTPETQTIFETLTNRFPGSDQYRRIKSRLMQQISDRFQGMIEISGAPNREARYAVHEDQAGWLPLVDRVLRLLTPWSTEGSCSPPAGLAGFGEKKDEETPKIQGAFQNALEMHWCHILIDPICSQRLTETLRLDPPYARLALPRFRMNDDKKGGNGSLPDEAAQLSKAERNQIVRELSARDLRRRLLRPRSFSVWIDEMCLGDLNLGRISQITVEIEEGAKFLEIRSEDAEGELSVAARFLEYSNGSFDSVLQNIPIANGSLRLSILPIRSASGISRAVVTVDLQPKLQLTWKSIKESWRPLHSWVAAACAMSLAIGVIAGGVFERLQLHHHQVGTLVLPTPPERIMFFMLVPDSQSFRDGGSAIPDVALRAGVIELNLKLPLSDAPQASAYSVTMRRFDDQREVLSEKALQATASSTINMAVPVSVLETGSYYVVELNAMSPDGHYREINHFTFRVVAKDQ